MPEAFSTIRAYSEKAYPMLPFVAIRGTILRPLATVLPPVWEKKGCTEPEPNPESSLCKTQLGNEHYTENPFATSPAQ